MIHSLLYCLFIIHIIKIACIMSRLFFERVRIIVMKQNVFSTTRFIFLLKLPSEETDTGRKIVQLSKSSLLDQNVNKKMKHVVEKNILSITTLEIVKEFVMEFFHTTTSSEARRQRNFLNLHFFRNCSEI